MSKFKPGDVVIILETETDPNFTQRGEKGLVIREEPGWPGCYEVTVPFGSGRPGTWVFYEEHLELAT